MDPTSSASTSPEIIVDKRREARLRAGLAFFALDGGSTQLADPSGNTSYDSGGAINGGAWKHVAVTVARGQANGGTFFVDGVSVGTFNPTARAGSLDNSVPLRLARCSDPASVQGFFNGAIDEVELFKRALSAAEVAGIHTAGAAGKCKPPQTDTNGNGLGDVCDCGDGSSAGTRCDDGNHAAGDGCLLPARSTGWQCSGEPPCDGICGDGAVVGTEPCDYGDTDNNNACTNACRSAACGDGFTWFGFEQCDDGNLANNDGCSSVCHVEYCGDGIRQTSEACDDGNADNTDGCLTTCALASCGDGYVRAGVEACDDGNQSNQDGCLNTCVAATCGDGFVHTGVEPCDDGNQSNTDACLNGCIAATCGDGYVRAGVEGCDDTNTNDNDACLNTARPRAAATAWRNGVEQCDDGERSNTDACTNATTLAAATASFAGTLMRRRQASNQPPA
jgi:cysteine-rich repeat protein